jgi:hypothetical protein
MISGKTPSDHGVGVKPIAGGAVYPRRRRIRQQSDDRDQAKQANGVDKRRASRREPAPRQQ